VPASPTLTAAAGYEVVVLEGCDGTGKTTLATALATKHGYTVMHFGRTPGTIDLAERYRSVLSRPGRIVLDRSFISELVYGPLRYGRSRLSVTAAAELALQVADRRGVLIHLTGRPDEIAARLQARDGYAPTPEQVAAVINAYQDVFYALAGIAPIITVDVTADTP
jgi:thymidylate kinase